MCGEADQAQSLEQGAPTWRCGPWRLEPRGLRLCGNTAEPFSQEIADQISETQSEARPGEAYTDRLNSRRDASAVITQQEVDNFLSLTSKGEEVWETVVADERVQVKRHRDRNLCGGVFVKLSAHLKNVKDIAHATACYVDFPYKESWDQQMTGFRILHSVAGNDVMYYKMHASPLSDRDFVVFQTMMRHDSGKGLLIYMRGADPKLVPATSAVRATMFVTATTIMEHPEGGVTIEVISGVDPRIPFLPKWIINAMVPSEWRKNMVEVDKRCQELHRAGKVPACACLFAKDTEDSNPQVSPAITVLAGDDRTDQDGSCKSRTASPLMAAAHASAASPSKQKSGSDDGRMTAPSTQHPSTASLETLGVATPDCSPGATKESEECLIEDKVVSQRCWYACY